MSAGPELTLRLEPGRLAIWRLPADAAVPEGLCRDAARPLLGWLRSGDELSVVGPEEMAPDEAPRETGFRAFAVLGPLDFSLVGVLRRILEPLADAEIPVFVLSTFDTDWILVRQTRLEDAVAALEGAALRITRSA